MAKKGTFPANAMRRGEIYWVDIPNAIGHELMKDRPAIIVSCDALNDNSPVVQVVYCSASPKKELPEHITIRSTEQISTALCENVYTVDKSRVGGGVDHKVTCSHCGRRRYGATYTIEKHSKSKA